MQIGYLSSQVWLNWRIENIRVAIMKEQNNIACSCGDKNLTTRASYCCLVPYIFSVGDSTSEYEIMQVMDVPFR